MRVAALRVERIPLAGVAFWSGANLRTDQRDHRAKWFTIEFQMNFRISVSISKKKNLTGTLTVVVLNLYRSLRRINILTILSLTKS